MILKSTEASKYIGVSINTIKTLANNGKIKSFKTLGGPTGSTKLDKCNGVVQFDYLTVIATIDCKGDKWTSEL